MPKVLNANWLGTKGGLNWCWGKGYVFAKPRKQAYCKEESRSYVGTTPFESTTLGPGRYRVNVSATGYETYAEDIEINGDRTSIVVAFRQVSLDERLAVIHKHRFGDCAGELVANTSGLRYQTSDDDAFEVSLEAMEEFTIDYLEHNLRIKVRDGRTYNFTDEQDNADALLVFHRTVEDARRRLASGDRPVLP